MATNPIDPIDQDIDIPPAPPEGIYDADFRNKVIALLAWFKTMVIQFTTFIEKLNIWTNQVNNLSPKIEAAAAVGELVNYTGEHVEGNSYSPPTVVSKDEVFYIALRTTDTTPPSADWKEIELEKGDTHPTPNSIVKRTNTGDIWLGGKDGARVYVSNNTVRLYSRYGATDENRLELYKYKYSSRALIRVIDKDGNLLGDPIRFDNGIWNIQATPIIDWQNVTLASGYGDGYVQVRKLANGFVELKINAKQTNGESGYHWVQVCTLPNGFRPTEQIEIAQITSRGGYTGRIQINTNGKVFAEAIGDYYHFARLAYYAGL